MSLNGWRAPSRIYRCAAITIRIASGCIDWSVLPYTTVPSVFRSAACKILYALGSPSRIRGSAGRLFATSVTPVGWPPTCELSGLGKYGTPGGSGGSVIGRGYCTSHCTLSSEKNISCARLAASPASRRYKIETEAFGPSLSSGASFLQSIWRGWRDFLSRSISSSNSLAFAFDSAAKAFAAAAFSFAFAAASPAVATSFDASALYLASSSSFKISNLPCHFMAKCVDTATAIPAKAMIIKEAIISLLAESTAADILSMLDAGDITIITLFAILAIVVVIVGVAAFRRVGKHRKEDGGRGG